MDLFERITQDNADSCRSAAYDIIN